jgi:sugar phosphate permease
MVKKFGEPALISGSLVLTAISLAPIPFVHCREPLSWAVLSQPAGLPWIALLLLLALLSVGTGLTRPPLFGLLSNLTSAEEQGVTIGVAQSAGSLARIVGPVFAAGLFFVHPTVPYSICGGILLVTGIVVWQRLRPVDASNATAHREGPE